MSLKKLSSCLLAITLLSPNVYAASDFIVKKIRVEGLQGISLATVLSYVPIHAGQALGPDQTSAIINALYQTGFFSDVSLSREGNDLVIHVVERSTIGIINITGNKVIKKKELLSALRQEGISEGLPYDHGVLTQMKQALEQQYYLLGRYNAKVTTTVVQEPRHRVALNINIYEGVVAKVRQISIIGNQAFKDKTLLNNFKLTTPKLWSFFTKSDEYSREKLEADLESLRNFYLDRGYLRFKIDSTEVSVTPDRKNIYISIHVTEGPIFTISGFKLTGDLLGKEAELRKLITIKPGQVFSRSEAIKYNSAIGKYFANKGYALVGVNIVPEINDATKQVFLTFDINPGKRVYVRRVDFIGNTRTSDDVLRRETRQMEGGLFSLSNVDESKRRLNNLGYLDKINVKMQPVPNSPNQVDLDYNVKEISSGQVSGSVGYSDAYGFLYGANINENNFMGTGKQVGVGFNNSQYAQTYSFNYFNPYYTVSGIGRGFSAYFQHVSPNSVNLASYGLDIYGLTQNYRLNMSEYDTLNFSYGYEYYKLKSNDPSVQITNFMNQYGTSFNNFKITAGWNHNTYDRAIFPTSGFNQWLGLEAGLPILSNSLNYYKLTYDAKWFHPIHKGFILSLNGDLGYGNGYGKFKSLPFFKNFFAGGIGSVRGYAANTLGPVDSLGNPFGGNILADGSVNLIVPNPISEKIRTSVFVDAGNIYQNQLNFKQLRYSTGIEVDWYSPLGPLQFSLAKAINPHSPDQTQVFNFSIGTSF